MDKEVSFDVSMTPSYMYKFMLYHSYTSIGGLFGILLSIIAIVLFFATFSWQTDMGKGVLLFIALLWTVINPIMLLSRSRRQVKMNPSYKKALTYTMNSQGITVSQDDLEETIPWDKLQKIVLTKSQLLVYSSKIHAFIFPLAEIGDKFALVKEIVNANTEGKIVKVSKKFQEK